VAYSAAMLARPQAPPSAGQKTCCRPGSTARRIMPSPFDEGGKEEIIGMLAAWKVGSAGS